MAFADINPATNNALNLSQRVSVRENPVINGQDLISDVQHAIGDQGGSFANYAHVVRLVILRLMDIAHNAAGLHHCFADDIFAPG